MLASHMYGISNSMLGSSRDTEKRCLKHVFPLSLYCLITSKLCVCCLVLPPFEGGPNNPYKGSGLINIEMSHF